MKFTFIKAIEKYAFEVFLFYPSIVFEFTLTNNGNGLVTD